MSNSSITRIAVAGPNSALATALFDRLLAAGFVVTALTRNASKTTIDAAIDIVQADYSSAGTLKSALKGQDVLVDLLNDRTMAASMVLLDAAVAAGVPHIIPGSFGLDFQNDFMRPVPLVAAKVKLEDRVVALGKEGKISYTIIRTGMFLDWAISKGYIIPLEGGKVGFFDGGEALQSLSLLDDIATAIVTTLPKRNERPFRCGILCMHSVVASPKQILDYAQGAAGSTKTWEVLDQDAQTTYEKSKEAFAQGSRDPMTFRGFLAGYIKAGVNLFPRVDNDILAVQTMSESQLRDLVTTFVQGEAGAKLPYHRH